MRQLTKLPIEAMGISEITFDPKSRDDIPPLLLGLQYIFMTPEIREEVFSILLTILPKKIDRTQGRPGLDIWRIFVMGVLRVNLNWDYDRLHEMVNNHVRIRQILGHGPVDDGEQYGLQRLKDNLVLLTPEVLGKIDQLVVSAGHDIIKKTPSDKKKEDASEESLKGRCDSFVVETHIEYPTDTRLLFESIRKVIELLMPLCILCGLFMLKGRKEIKALKKVYTTLRLLKHSTSKKEDKKQAREAEIKAACEAYLDKAGELLSWADSSLSILRKLLPQEALLEIESFRSYAALFLDQVRRRVVQGETIPHDEKVFSIFKPYSQWISKGKAGVPVEFGLNVCVLEDQHQFILFHYVMTQETDDKIAVTMVDHAQRRFPALTQCSFDKGFHSPENQKELAKRLDFVVLPRKGKLSAAQAEHQQCPRFIEARRQHAAVESGINALEVHGLDRCRDDGINGFKRYVALAITGRNIQLLGVYLRRYEAALRKDDFLQAA